MSTRTRREAKPKVSSKTAIGKGEDDVTTITKEKAAVPTDGTMVRCGAGITISKNYNSVRIDCQVEYPATVKTAKAAATAAWDFVEAELTDQIAEAEKLLRKL